MADETKEVDTPPVNNNEIEQLKESVKKLEAKNFELIGKLQKKDEKVVPEDYDRLIAYKKKAEKEKLENEDNQTEEKQDLTQTKTNRSYKDQKRIESEEDRKKE